ncbi:T9SS type A sorting domain-containing protein [Flavobacterium longum]|uniref:T9SS type A sorting domain-containing protein n=1 Tax=Flavobacterium longum TaxID=1299340 RepID=UPI0039E8B77B
MKRFLFLTAAISFFGATAQQAGELDPGFGVGGFVITQDLQGGTNIAIMPDDRIVMVGGYSQFNIIRLMPDGTPDTTFGVAGISSVDFGLQNDYPYDVAVQPDGKIVVIGVIDGPSSTNDQAVGATRLNADGTLDTTFNGNGQLVFDFADAINHPNAVALQDDGKILIAGYTGASSAANDFAIVRLNPDGSFDTTFDTDGKARINVQGDDRARAMAIAPDGKIIVGGMSYPVGVNNCGFAAIRLLTDGSLDNTFSTDGRALAKIGSGNDSVFDLAVQPDGKVILVADSSLGSQDIGVVRFDAAGNLDTTFSGDGKFSTFYGPTNSTDYINAVTLQPDGKILVAGSYFTTPERNLGLIRLTANGELDTTFSDDGKANYVVPGDNGVSVYDMDLQSTGQILVSGYAANDFMLARIFSGNEELGLPETASASTLFYPNPASGQLFFADNIRTASIYTIDGKLALQQDVSGPADISTLAKGIYVIALTTTNGHVLRRKLSAE